MFALKLPFAALLGIYAFVFVMAAVGGWKMGRGKGVSALILRLAAAFTIAGLVLMGVITTMVDESGTSPFLVDGKYYFYMIAVNIGLPAVSVFVIGGCLMWRAMRAGGTQDQQASQLSQPSRSPKTGEGPEGSSERS